MQLIGVAWWRCESGRLSFNLETWQHFLGRKDAYGISGCRVIGFRVISSRGFPSLHIGLKTKGKEK